jgi:hypothetical protein
MLRQWGVSEFTSKGNAMTEIGCGHPSSQPLSLGSIADEQQVRLWTGRCYGSESIDHQVHAFHWPKAGNAAHHKCLRRDTKTPPDHLPHMQPVLQEDRVIQKVREHRNVITANAFPHKYGGKRTRIRGH